MATACMTGEGIGSLTSPCQGGCGLRGPVPRRILADRIDIATRAETGQTVQVRMDGVIDRDHMGRIAHVVGVEIEGYVGITVAQGPTTSNLPGYNFFRKFDNIFLEDVSGHQYLNGLNGQRLIDDRFFRNWRTGPANRGIGVGELDSNLAYTDFPFDRNAGGGVPAALERGALVNPLPTGTPDGSYFVPVRLVFPFTPQHSPTLRGAIPLQAIRDRGRQAFRFNVIDIPPALLPAEATDDGFVTTDNTSTLNVWLHVVYLDALYIDSGWQLEDYTENDQSGRLRHADRIHEFIVGNPDLLDNDPSGDFPSYRGYSFQVGNDQIVSALSDYEMVRRDEYAFESDIMARPSDRTWYVVDTAGLPRPYRMFVPRAKSRLSMGSGVVTFNYSQRQAENTRYLHRTILCQGKNRAEQIAMSVFGCGCGPQSGVTGVAVNEGLTPTSTAQDPAAGLLISVNK